MFDLRAMRAGRLVEGVHGYVALLWVAASSGKASQGWRIVTILPGIGTILAAEFLAHAGTLTTYPAPRRSPRTPGSRRSPATPDAARATRPGRTATTAGYAGCSACPASPP
ncbi:hypothetical protein AB0K29_03955 [Micromonospora humida]